MLRHKSFSFKLCILIIDELYLIEEWQEFKIKYANLNIFRIRLLIEISILRVFVILNNKIEKIIRSQYKFDEQIKVLRTLLNRSKIFLQFIEIKKTIKNILNF